jgi:hypothetical protein
MLNKMDEEDLKIERGELDPVEEGYLYPKGVLTVLNLIFKKKNYERPKGKQSPKFSTEEITALADFIFFKPENIIFKVYERKPKERDMPFKRKVFINHFLGDAKFNAAKAARMAGYSPKSAKQIAYKIKQT